MSLVLLTLLLTAADPALETALQRAVSRDRARVELVSWEAPRCKGAFAPAPFDVSGRVPVRVRGKACEGWGWATVRVYVPVATLQRDVKANEPLDGAWTVSEAEPRGEVLASVPTGATATRWLRKGATMNQADVRVGPKPGTPVTVRVLVGSLSLESRGTIAPCSVSEICATLPSGKKVAGVWSDGVLTVGGAL